MVGGGKVHAAEAARRFHFVGIVSKIIKFCRNLRGRFEVFLSRLATHIYSEDTRHWGAREQKA